MFKRIILLLILIISLFSSCGKKEAYPDIKLPATPLLSLSSRWGVITSSYLRMREKPDINSRAVTTLWKGYILEIVSRSPGEKIVEDKKGYWYQVTYEGLQGWVFSTYLRLFDSLEEAERSSRELRR